MWRGNASPACNGVVVLGSPVGSPEFVQQFGTDLLQGEQQLLDRLLELPSLQSSWLLLSYCAAPRSNYSLRTTPPNLVREYALAHDRQVLNTLSSLLQLHSDNLKVTTFCAR